MPRSPPCCLAFGPVSCSLHNDSHRAARQLWRDAPDPSTFSLVSTDCPRKVDIIGLIADIILHRTQSEPGCQAGGFKPTVCALVKLLSLHWETGSRHLHPFAFPSELKLGLRHSKALHSQQGLTQSRREAPVRSAGWQQPGLSFTVNIGELIFSFGTLVVPGEISSDAAPHRSRTLGRHRFEPGEFREVMTRLR